MFRGDCRLALLGVPVCAAVLGLYAVVPRLAGYVVGFVLVYLFLPYLLVSLFLAARRQVRLVRNRRHRGVPVR
ncbi:MAG: hypothetical protein ABR950_10775 [Candidatus Dormibacteria bacterium]